MQFFCKHTLELEMLNLGFGWKEKNQQISSVKTNLLPSFNEEKFHLSMFSSDPHSLRRRPSKEKLEKDRGVSTLGGSVHKLPSIDKEQGEDVC